MVMVLHAAVAVLLHRLGGGQDIVVGTPVAGRDESALNEVIGFFVNTVVLPGDLAGDPTFLQVVERARQTASAPSPVRSSPSRSWWRICSRSATAAAARSSR